MPIAMDGEIFMMEISRFEYYCRRRAMVFVGVRIVCRFYVSPSELKVRFAQADAKGNGKLDIDSFTIDGDLS